MYFPRASKIKAVQPVPGAGQDADQDRFAFGTWLRLSGEKAMKRLSILSCLAAAPLFLAFAGHAAPLTANFNNKISVNLTDAEKQAALKNAGVVVGKIPPPMFSLNMITPGNPFAYLYFYTPIEYSADPADPKVGMYGGDEPPEIEVHWQATAGTTYLIDCKLVANVADGANAVTVDIKTPMPISKGHLLLVRKAEASAPAAKYFVRLQPIPGKELIFRGCDITAL
jgi:hypothetical protein